MNESSRELRVPVSESHPARTAHPPMGSERRLSPGALALFMLGSFFVHGGAFAALGSLPSEAPRETLPAEELAFTVLAPSAAPMEPTPPPAPPLVPRPRPRAEPVRQQVSTPTPAPAAEPPPVQTLGVSSDSGLAVAGQVGAPTALAGTSLTGVQGGKGSGPAPAAPTAPRVDLRKLTTEWVAKVSREINERASREYPRSALRAHVQGALMLRIRVATSGRIEAVELASSSGHEALDQAALSAARAVGQVPAPPAALHAYLRPFPVSVSYVIR